MAIYLENAYTVFVGSSAEVTPVLDYKQGSEGNHPQKVDGNNLPLWSVPVELVHGEEVTTTPLKIASVEKPELKPRTDYIVDGALEASPWLNGNRVAISYKLVGKLVEKGAPAPFKK